MAASDPNYCPSMPQRAECRSSLMAMVPGCGSFLTNSSVYEPESSCCDGFRSIITGPDRFMCICHVVNGDLGKLLPAPMHHMRMVELFTLCGSVVDANMLAAACDLCTDQIPPMDVPNHLPLAPAPAPAPAN
ncbi:hypothetical protein ACP70R_023124 [Stipagrostis hirtigluma subsp. patula]